MKTVSRTQARARARGWRLLEGHRGAVPVHSKRDESLERIRDRQPTRRRHQHEQEDAWPDDPVELFRWLEQGARRR